MWLSCKHISFFPTIQTVALVTLLLLIVSGDVLALQSGGAIGFQTNLYPNLRVADRYFPNTQTYTISLKGYQLDKSPLEYGMHITFGYDKDIAFSYGVSLAYLMRPFQNTAIKTGFRLDRLQVNKDAFTGYFNEQQTPNDAHESIDLFLEWEVFPSQNLSFFINGNYRISRSQNLISSTLIKEEVSPDGSTTQTFSEKYSSFFYGSGFHIGLGMQIHF